MLFDTFTDQRSIDLQDEIVNNISDIIDSCNHSNDNMLPYSFGLNGVNLSHTGEVFQVIENVKDAIERFEPRLSHANVAFVSNSNGTITFEISGFYEQERQRIYLRFKKAMRDLL